MGGFALINWIFFNGVTLFHRLGAPNSFSVEYNLLSGVL